MRKIIIAIISLLGFIAVDAQTASTEPTTLVVRTTDGLTSRFSIDDIEEIYFDNTAAETSTIVRLLNLTPEFISISGLEELQTLNAGEEAVLTITAGPILSAGFQDYHFEHIHVQVNDRVIVPQAPEGYTPSEEIKVTFEVPAGECDIVVCYSVQQQLSPDGFTMTLDENPHVKLYGVSPDCRYKYFDAYLLVDEAYVITDAEFKMGDGEWTSVEGTPGCSLSPDYNVPNLYQITIRPDYQNVTGNIELRVSGEQHHRYAISWPNADPRYLDLEKSTLPAQAIDGDVVVAELYINDDYYLKGASASDGTHVETLYGAYVRFTMPASDVAISLDICEKIPVTCAGGQHVKEAKIYDAPDIYYGGEVSVGVPGGEVYVIAIADEGYKPVTATTDAGASFAFSHYGLDMYVCPLALPENATSVAVTVECGRAWTVSSHQEVSFADGVLYTEGETVKFAMQVPSGKQIESVAAVTSSGRSLDLTLDLPYASFVMPAEDVEISVTYSDLAIGDTVSVIAYFDEDQYGVNSSTNYDWDFAEGFNIDKGATFYLSVLDYYGENFYVGVKIGESVTIYPAVEDEESGEYSFGKALVADGDVIIKVGPSETSVGF